MTKGKEETIEKIKHAALDEFYDKGYVKASLMQFILKHRKETIVIMEKAQGSCYEQFHVKIEQMMEQSFYMYYQNRLGTAPDKGLIRILAKQRLDSCLEIVKGDYDMEYSMYLVEQTGIYAEGGTEKLIKNLKELHSR